jgi:hypothetical protein
MGEDEFVWWIDPVEGDPFLVKHAEIKGWGIEIREIDRVPNEGGLAGERTLYPWESLTTVARRHRDRLEEAEH